MSIFSRLADAEKLSIPQLQMSIKNGTIPAYAGIPLLEQKVREAQRAKVAQAPQQPPIAEEVMAAANGITDVPSNLPEATAKDGGIIAFADGGTVDPDNFDLEEYEDQQDEAEYAQAIEDRLNAAEQGGEARPKAANVNRTPDVEGGIKAPAGDFYKNMYATLKAKAEEMGFKNPEAIARVGAAQSALETGYGKALAGGNNYFGIKGSGGNKQSTKEYSPERGYYTSNESFRTYNNMGDSAADYLRLMQNPRYAKVAAAETPEEAIAHQGRSGYATSPNYAPSLRAIHSANMAEGGIARLNNGGVAHFQSGKLVNSYPGSTPSDMRMTEDKDMLLDPFVATAPEELYPYAFDPNLPPRRRGSIRPRTSTGVIPATVATQGNVSGVPSSINAEVADSNRRQAAAAAGVVESDQMLSGSENAMTATASPKNPTLVANDLYGGVAPSKDFSFANPKTGVDALTDTGAGSSTVDTSSTSSKGEKQKSEYDLIREDIMNQREELKRQKQEDKYMAILQAGLGMMGGTSPNAFANIGQGASAGIAQYGQSAKQRAAENAALNKGLLSAQRYKSMDEYQRAALADKAAGRSQLAGIRSEEQAEKLGLKQEELERLRERDIGTFINQGSARVAAELKAKFPNPDLLTPKEKAAYAAEEKRLYGDYVAPYITVQNQMLQKRYPEYFKNDASVRPSAPSNRVLFGSL